MEQTNIFEETENSLSGIGFNFDTERIKINIPNAKENFSRGMAKYLCTDKPQWVEGYEKIIEWLADNKGKGLLLTGDVGLGKSVFCMKVLPVLINFYHRKLIYPYYADEINKRFEEIISKKLVCIDDVGTENEFNEYGNKRIVFNEIVDKAERNGNFIVVNTNLTTDEIEKRYGKRTLDRLRAITQVVILKGKSKRG